MTNTEEPTHAECLVSLGLDDLHAAIVAAYCTELESVSSFQGAVWELDGQPIAALWLPGDEKTDPDFFIDRKYIYFGRLSGQYSRHGLDAFRYDHAVTHEDPECFRKMLAWVRRRKLLRNQLGSSESEA